MPKGRRRMQVEGVTYMVEWRKLQKGMSLFFPCLDHDRAKAQVMVVTNRLGINIVTKSVIEDGIRGLRLWRV